MIEARVNRVSAPAEPKQSYVLNFVVVSKSKVLDQFLILNKTRIKHRLSQFALIHNVVVHAKCLLPVVVVLKR